MFGPQLSANAVEAARRVAASLYFIDLCVNDACVLCFSISMPTLKLGFVGSAQHWLRAAMPFDPPNDTSAIGC